ncbi:rasV [Acrasis kona]|uniref:RasV n=1 Tax=Acrasis kona TaxID=1008807 RepID=A0AAW2ZKT5_9EUKA
MFVPDTISKDFMRVIQHWPSCSLNDDVIATILQFLPYNISMYLKIGAISKQLYTFMSSEELWCSLLRNKYPFLPITDNYRPMCIEFQRLTRGGNDEYLKHYCDVIKLTIAGSAHSGKTRLMDQYVFGQVPQYHDSILRKQITIFQDKTELFEIYDSSRVQDETHRSSEQAYQQIARLSSAFIIACSVTDRMSFEDLDDHLKLICRVKDIDPCDLPIMLVATKKDLVSERVVTEDELKSFAEEHKISYMETSVLTGENVDYVFTTLAEMAYIYLAFFAIKRNFDMNANDKGSKKRKCIIN